MNKTYITTAIPYVNGMPHIGHAMDYCLADVCARYHRLLGDEVKFQAGVDEHGNKIFQKAKLCHMPIPYQITHPRNSSRLSIRISQTISNLFFGKELTLCKISRRADNGSQTGLTVAFEKG